MDMIQLIIIAVVLVLILVTISYYLYQEAKFKKMVENNFNQATDDIIIEENKVFTLDGIDTQNTSIPNQILQKDVVLSKHVDNDPLFDMMIDETAKPSIKKPQIEKYIKPTLEIEEKAQADVHPEHSVEAFFAKIHKVDFPFINNIVADLDFIIDIGFEEAQKIKVLPEISQFTNKPFQFYVLDKNNEWSEFKKGSKYTALALKLVVGLIDNEGIISQAQLSNIFNELHKFVMQNEAHICKSDYEVAISKLQRQMKYMDKIELNLTLFMAMKEYYPYSDIQKYFTSLDLIHNNGILQLCENNQQVFKISAVDNAKFSLENSYNMLQITANLHMQQDPNYAVEKIFDCMEQFMQHYEARLLTSNKHILVQKDYDAILHHVKRHIESAKANGIELGGELIKRLFN